MAMMSRISAAIFGLLHTANPGATAISDVAIALEAGVLLDQRLAAVREQRGRELDPDLLLAANEQDFIARRGLGEDEAAVPAPDSVKCYGP